MNLYEIKNIYGLNIQQNEGNKFNLIWQKAISLIDLAPMTSL
jgi:hypothetical protein